MINLLCLIFIDYEIVCKLFQNFAVSPCIIVLRDKKTKNRSFVFMESKFVCFMRDKVQGRHFYRLISKAQNEIMLDAAGRHASCASRANPNAASVRNEHCLHGLAHSLRYRATMRWSAWRNVAMMSPTAIKHFSVYSS